MACPASPLRYSDTAHRDPFPVYGSPDGLGRKRRGAMRTFLLGTCRLLLGLCCLPSPAALPPGQTEQFYLSVFGDDEQYLTKFSHATLDDSTGMAVNHAGLLYVSGFVSDNVVVFDLDGNFQRAFTGGGLNGRTVSHSTRRTRSSRRRAQFR